MPRVSLVTRTGWLAWSAYSTLRSWFLNSADAVGVDAGNPTSQRRTIRSSLTDATVMPSGLIATSKTQTGSACVGSTSRTRPVTCDGFETSQTITLPSRPPETSVRPSGAYLSEKTPNVWPPGSCWSRAQVRVSYRRIPEIEFPTARTGSDGLNSTV
jgi:hypothetical protein